MSLFQKYYNHAFREKLEVEKMKSYYDEEYDIFTGPGPYIPTIDERKWLSHMLLQKEADVFLRSDTRKKLQKIVGESSSYNGLTVKEVSSEKGEWNTVHQQIRRYIMENKACKISYETRNGTYFQDQIGYPFTLQFNIVKKKWYLIWVRAGETQKQITPLSLIDKVEETEVEYRKPQMQETEIESIILRVNPDFDQEIQRLFLTFSCFEKELTNSDNGITMEIRYFVDEREYVLSRIRQLGPHVTIISPSNLAERMKDTAQKALEVYGGK